MKKILFIIQSYPSKLSANVLCDEKIMLEMIKSGNYDVHALTYQYNKQPLYEEINGIKVHRFCRNFFWNSFTWAMDNNKKIIAKIIIKINYFSFRIKQIIHIPSYPNYEINLSKLYARKAIELHQKHMFDIIFAEHNGNDTVYAGMAVKKYDQNVKFIPVFWDALSGTTLAKYLPATYAKKKLISFEREILEQSDIAISMKAHKDYMVKLWGNDNLFSKIKYLDIPYLQKGIDKSNDKKILRKDKINIVFAGSMAKRNILPFLRCIKKKCENLVIIWIYTASKYHFRLNEIISEFNNFVIINDYVPHDKLIQILSEADFFLNFGVKNPNAISGKIFEYMGYGKPIISTYSIHNEACIPYISNYKLGYLFNENFEKDEQSSESLKDFIIKNLNKRINYEDIENQYYINTPHAYIDQINTLM